jgi:hypothetical protein
MRPSRREQYLIAAGLGVLLAGVGLAPADAASAPATETSAQSQAVLARLVPYVGLPGVTTSVGLATAQVSSGVARSSAAAADFGLLGTLASAGAEGAPAVPGAPELTLPSPISADSEGTTAVERDSFNAPGGLVGKESAIAAEEPLGARGLVTGPALSVPGLLEATGGAADAAAAGEAGATSVVTLDRLDLGAGQVVLSGLRWAAGQKPAAAATSGFSVRGMTIAGQIVPVDSPAQLAEAVASANTVLAPLGLTMTVPVSAADASGATVAPLVIQVRNPDTLVEPSRQVSSALTPVMTKLMKAVTAANEDAAAAQIVANAVVGATGGRSGGRLELGGVSARASLVELGVPAASDTATPAAGALPPVLPPSTPDASVPLPADIAPAATETEVPSAFVTAAAPQSVTPAVFNAPKDTKRTAAAVGLGIILAVIVALAVGDRIRIAAAAK